MVNKPLSVRRNVSTHNLIRTGIVALAILSVVLTTAAADTAVATRWKSTGETQTECMGHAQMAIFRAGFDPRGPGSQSMSGKRGDYTASIRCIAEQRMVIFVMAGPSADATSRYLEELYGHWLLIDADLVRKPVPTSRDHGRQHREGAARAAHRQFVRARLALIDAVDVAPPPGGPLAAKVSIIAATASAGPANNASTEPSRRLRTQPCRPSRPASYSTKAR